MEKLTKINMKMYHESISDNEIFGTGTVKNRLV